jgi:FixJ family two-component response regulator
MSAVSNFATFVPGTEMPESKHREILPFAGSLLARCDAGYAGDRSAQSNSRFLAPRERDVLAMISQGFSNKCIARALAISPETVKPTSSVSSTSTRSHRAVLRGRDETAASPQASSLRSLWRTIRHGDASCPATTLSPE